MDKQSIQNNFKTHFTALTGLQVTPTEELGFVHLSFTDEVLDCLALEKITKYINSTFSFTGSINRLIPALKVSEKTKKVSLSVSYENLDRFKETSIFA